MVIPELCGKVLLCINFALLVHSFAPMLLNIVISFPLVVNYAVNCELSNAQLWTWYLCYG